MTKQLSIAAALVFAVACKTDAPSSGTAASAGEGTSGKARSAKIAVKPVPPTLPAAPEASDDNLSGDDPPRGPAGRDEWRKRRQAMMDTNGDGVISDEERATAMRERASHMRTRLDADGDGKLTPAELAKAPGRMHFDDPAAVDTNHDGDISADELAAAFKARLEQWRSKRGSDAPTTP